MRLKRGAACAGLMVLTPCLSICRHDYMPGAEVSEDTEAGPLLPRVKGTRSQSWSRWVHVHCVALSLAAQSCLTL